MSDFLKKLDRVSRERGQPLGFAAMARAQGRLMLLVAWLPQPDISLATLAVTSGADALLLNAERSTGTQAVGKIGASISGIPWGVRLDTAGSTEMDELLPFGCDYVVLGLEAPAGVLGNENLGKVLEVDPKLSDALARSAGQLGLDALVLGSGDASGLTLSRVMHYRRIISLARMPAMAYLSPDTTQGELSRLWEVGVRAAVVDICVGSPEKRLAQVSDAIAGIAANRLKSKERISAIVPTVVLREEDAGSDEGDDDPDEDI